MSSHRRPLFSRKPFRKKKKNAEKYRKKKKHVQKRSQVSYPGGFFHRRLSGRTKKEEAEGKAVKNREMRIKVKLSVRYGACVLKRDTCRAHSTAVPCWKGCGTTVYMLSAFARAGSPARPLSPHSQRHDVRYLPYNLESVSNKQAHFLILPDQDISIHTSTTNADST